MGLRTVVVPPEMRDLFRRAEDVVSQFFRDRRDTPERGAIEIFGERYVLVRAASLSVEFFGLARNLYGVGREAEADAFARNLLFDLAHAIGRSDAHNFHAKMHLEDPIARLSAGPVHFAYTGWARVDILPDSTPVPGPDYVLVYEHAYTFESDAWLRAGETRDFPVCIMNAGYSSGWCEASFDLRLVATEILCRAKGDPCCRFVMAPPERIEEHVARYVGTPREGVPASRYEIPDLFARKRIEEELRRAHDELEVRVMERTAELTAANERLRAEMEERARVETRLRQANKLEAIGRLAGGIAHDFNNLLAIMMTRAALLTNNLRVRLPPDDASWEELGQIQDSIARATKLTRQLLTLGRPQVLQPETLDLNAVVAELGRTVLPLVGESVELVTHLADHLDPILADRGQIDQIVINLVVNARDAMPRGGTLTLCTEQLALTAPFAIDTGELLPGRYVVLSVDDTGTGMDEETLARAFDPFFTTKPDGKGTGLGLSTVYGIVRHAGGGIRVETAPGRGTRFSTYFPVVGRSTPPGPAVEEPPPARGTETLLLVEDRDELRRALEDVLRACGYTVLTARSGADALEIVSRKEQVLDLLVTDIVMPRMGGGELASRVLALRPGTKIIFMSGYAPEGALVETRAAMGRAFIAKPFRPEELVSRVRELLDAKATDS